MIKNVWMVANRWCFFLPACRIHWIAFNVKSRPRCATMQIWLLDKWWTYCLGPVCKSLTHFWPGMGVWCSDWWGRADNQILLGVYDLNTICCLYSLLCSLEVLVFIICAGLTDELSVQQHIFCLGFRTGFRFATCVQRTFMLSWFPALWCRQAVVCSYNIVLRYPHVSDLIYCCSPLGSGPHLQW